MLIPSPAWERGGWPGLYVAYVLILHTSRMIANFIVEGPGNVAKQLADKSFQSSTGLGGLPMGDHGVGDCQWEGRSSPWL